MMLASTRATRTSCRSSIDPHRRGRALVIACVLLLANAAIAEEAAEPSAYARPGAYVSLGGVAGLPNFDDPLPNPSAGGGVDVRVGYRVGARTAIELAYTGTFGSTNRFSGPPPLRSQYDTHLVAANARVFMATERIQPYVLVGMGALIAQSKLLGPLSADSTQAAYAVRLGAGADVYASEHWVVEIEGSYVIGSGQLEHRDYGLVGANVMFRF